MENPLSNNNFIAGLSTASAATSAALDHWWFAGVLLAPAFGRKIWLITAPAASALFTYAVFRVIDKKKAAKVAKKTHQRVLDRLHPKINSDSLPERASPG